MFFGLSGDVLGGGEEEPVAIFQVQLFHEDEKGFRSFVRTCKVKACHSLCLTERII